MRLPCAIHKQPLSRPGNFDNFTLLNPIHCKGQDLTDNSKIIFKRPLVVHRKFDFDIGNLIKSPCRQCRDRAQLPKCADTCEMIDRIQTRLARGISTTHSHSALEPFAVYTDRLKDK